jgi:hypothetical protein
MSLWLYAGTPYFLSVDVIPLTKTHPPTCRRQIVRYFAVGKEFEDSLKLRIWWSGQSAGNLSSKKGRALQRLHARACSTDSVPSGPKLEGNLFRELAGLIDAVGTGDGAIIVPSRIRSPKGKLYYPSILRVPKSTGPLRGFI